MIDLHNHILFGVDDGAQTISDSIAMIKSGVEQGFDTFVLTPHYMIYRGYTSPFSKNKKIFEQIVKACQAEGINANLILGSEIQYEFALTECYEENLYSTMGDTDYYLIETTRQNGTALGILNFVLFLEKQGKKAILAHPERYDFVQDDPNVLLDFIHRGVLIQSNYLSLIDYYDQKTTETIKIMLEHQMVHLMGSDAHQTEAYELYPRAKAVGAEIIGERQWNTFFTDNAEMFLAGEAFDINEPKPFRRPAKFGRVEEPDVSRWQKHTLI